MNLLRQTKKTTKKETALFFYKADYYKDHRKPKVDPTTTQKPVVTTKPTVQTTKDYD